MSPAFSFHLATFTPFTVSHTANNSSPINAGTRIDGNSIEANVLNTYRPLQLLGGAAYLKAFSREELEAMALLSLNTHSVGFNIAMMFLGCSCVALGYLTFASAVFLKALGVLMAIADVSYLTLSTAQLFSPRF